MFGLHVRSAVHACTHPYACISAQVTGPDRVVLHEKMVFSNVDDATGQVTATIMKKVRGRRGCVRLRAVVGCSWRVAAAG